MQAGIREAVGVFDNIHNLNEAVAELEVTAFPRQDISVRNGIAPMPENEDVVLGPLPEEDRPDTPRTILVRPEEKAIGVGVIVGGGFYAGAVTAIMLLGINSPLPALAMTGVLGGLGGMILGSIVAALLSSYYRAILNRQIREGHLILWVRTPGSREEQMACNIMKKHGGRRVHIHDIH